MSFRVGQEVVCVDDSDGFFPGSGLKSPVINGIIYVIAKIYPGTAADERLGLDLVGIHCPASEGFRSDRFRPIVKTDISIFEAMLAPSPKQRVTA